MRRAYLVIAWTLTIAATIAVLILWFTPPADASVHDGWRDLERVDSV